MALDNNMLECSTFSLKKIVCQELELNFGPYTPVISLMLQLFQLTYYASVHFGCVKHSTQKNKHFLLSRALLFGNSIACK
jgi:hypothetical protein